MALRVVGAGLPRTGTTSLKLALERLLGEPCYHMREVNKRPGDLSAWCDALRGGTVDWDAFLAGYAAAVDWPVSRFWRELSDHFDNALVLLSYRESPERWFTSMSGTILHSLGAYPAGTPLHVARYSADLPEHLSHLTDEQLTAADDLLSLLVGDLRFDDAAGFKAAYLAHFAEVRASVPEDRLLEWQPGDGWDPLCARLCVPVPDEPFPHENSTAEMLARLPSDSGRPDARTPQ